MRSIIATVFVLTCAMHLSAQNPPANPPTTTTDPTGRACVANSVLNYIPSGKLFTCQSGVYAAASAAGGAVTSITQGCGETFSTTPLIATGTISAAGPCYAAGGGTAQAQTAVYSPVRASLFSGLTLAFKPNAANSGAAPTFSPDGLTAHAIVKAGGALVANDLLTTAIAVVVYNATGTQWELQNPQTGVDINPATIPQAAYYTASSALSGTYYPMAFFNVGNHPVTAASGTFNVGPIVGTAAPFGTITTGNIASRYTIIDKACSLKRIAAYSDVGPGGAGNASTEALGLYSYVFTPGTALAFSAASLVLVDANATATVTGLTAQNFQVCSTDANCQGTFTTFTAPVTIPAYSLVAWGSTLGGGAATTNAMNFGLLVECR